MRSVEVTTWALWAGVACLGLAGCTTSPLSAGARPAQTPTVAAAGAAVAPPAAPEPPVPAAPAVTPAVQRAFDDAGRALRAGRVDDAQRTYRALVQSNPELGGPHANLGIIARQAGKLPEAVAELETAVRLSPRQPVYLNELGATYRQQGQFDKARTAYEQAIALDPNYAAPYLNLGILHDLYLGDPKRALELYDRYLALSPAGDALVAKWVVELKNRKAPANPPAQKEKA